MGKTNENDKTQGVSERELVQRLQFAESICQWEREALVKLKKILLDALNQLDADNPVTTIKLGSAVSRVVAGLDWEMLRLRRRKAHIAEIADRAKPPQQALGGGLA